MGRPKKNPDLSAEPASHGDRLRHARTKAGLTQAQLAARAGLSAVSISNIERGIMTLTAGSALLLADALGIPTSELLPHLPWDRALRVPPAITFRRRGVPFRYEPATAADAEAWSGIGGPTPAKYRDLLKVADAGYMLRILPHASRPE